MVIVWSRLDNLEECHSDDVAAFIVARDLCHASYARDYAIVQDAREILFCPVSKGQQSAWVSNLSNLFMHWRDDYPPTLPAFLGALCDFLGIDSNHPYFYPALTACILGEVYNDNQFHNTHHFREVLSLVIRFCLTHNELCDDPNDVFDPSDILLLVMAAAVHDFAHDGTNNGVGSSHVPSRLEKSAFERSKSFLMASGLDSNDLAIVEKLIIATDTSVPSEERSPSATVRHIAFHQDQGQPVSVSPAYECFVTDPKLARMALILCEADISPSSGLSYEFSKLMTRKLAREENIVTATARTLNGFLTHVCEERLISNPACYLLGDNFKYIQQASEKDAKKNIVY